MSTPPTLAAELEELEARVRALRIRVAEEGEPSSSASGAAPRPWSASWVDQLISAQTADEVSAVDLSPLDSLRAGRGHLSTSNGWDEKARLGRALRSGLIARRCLDSGDFRVEPLPSDLLLRVTISVCLTCPEHPEGFWTRRSRPFLQLVGDPTGRGQGPDPPHSVYCSFASEKEASAYLLGAGRRWPALEL